MILRPGEAQRHEPDVGEMHHPYLFDGLGWSGRAGCEYRPRAGAPAGLGWFEPYKAAQGCLA